MLAAGTPDERPERLAAALDRLVADDSDLGAGSPRPSGPRPTSARARLLASRGAAVR